MEPALARLRRRSLTVPGMLALATAAWLAAPLLLLGALAVDGLRGGPWPATRLAVFGLVYLACEALGLVASFVLWAAGGPWRRASRARFEDWNFRLQVLWARTLFAGAKRAFGLRVGCAGLEGLGAGPALVFLRHASLADTLLPAVFLSGRLGWRLRYVLKRELLLDPCLDVVGQRLPNVFVRRGSGQSEPEIAAIRGLAQGLGPGEGVLIYPEGTRASPERRRRALERVAATGDTERLARVRALRHLLPPRSGGPLALLDAARGVDVVFGVHAGFDGVTKLGDVLSGALVGRRVELAFWRVPGDDVPADPVARLPWLDARWAELDAWVAKRLPEMPAEPSRWT